MQRLTPTAIPAFRSAAGLRELESSVPAKIEPGAISTRPRSAEPPLPSVVQGTVRDVATGRPPAGGIDRVGPSPYLAQSDAAGCYELNVLELPNHSVATAARDGYVPDSRELTLGPRRHLATALGMAACQQGHKVRFFRLTELITLLLEAREEKKSTRFFERSAENGLQTSSENHSIAATFAGKIGGPRSL